MKISTEETKAGFLVSLKGPLDEVCADVIKRELTGVFLQDKKYVLLDFSGVTKLSAVGLRYLLPYVQLIHHQKKQIILFNLNDSIHGLIKNSGFGSLVVIKKTLAEAVAYAAENS
ncbi:STAS domain-containing protein [Rufibacter soli]|jgi:anti-anti-sigma factor